MQSGSRISWSNPKVLIILLLVFACGSLSGAIVYRFAHAHIVRAQPDPISWGQKAAFLAKAQKDLNLTQEQTLQMSRVLDDYKMYYQNLQEQLEEVRATGKGRILQILDEQQRQKFEKLLADAK